MRRLSEAGLFGLLLAGVLLFQFRTAFAPGHYLYPAVIEDPAARFSFLPWDTLTARLLRQGEFPLWNSLSGAGMPLLANLQSSVLFPLKWPYYLFRAPRLLDLMVIIRIALAAAFVFLLARQLGRSSSAAAVSGLCFGLSGYMMKHLNMVNVAGEMWLPLLLLLAARSRRRLRKSDMLLAAAAFGLVFCAGNPEAAFYVILLDLLFVLVIADGRRRLELLLGIFAAPLLLGGLLAAAQGLPFLEYLGAGWHIHNPSLHLLAPHPPALIGSLVAPWLLGAAGQNPAQLTSAPFLGSVTLLLATIGALSPAGRTRTGLFFAGAGVLLLALVYSLPPLGLLSSLPPLNRGGNAKFAMSGVSLAAAMLAGAGFDVIAGRRLSRKPAALALAVVSVLLFGGTLGARTYGTIAASGYVMPFLFLAATAATLIVCLRRQRSGAKPDARLLVSVPGFLAAAELLLLFYGFRFDTAFAPGLLRQPPDVPEALRPVAEDPAGPRFTGIAGALQPNLNLLVGVRDLRAFDGLYPRRYVAAMGRIEGFGLDTAVENFFSHGWSFDVRPKNLASPLLDRLGVKYVVAREELNQPGFVLVRSGDYRVYRNDEAWPRAATLAGGKRLPAEVRDVGSGRVEIVASGPGELVLADSFFPGWRATLDGLPAAIRPADGLFRALTLPAGRHRAAMIYAPWGFRAGLWVSLASLAAGAAALAARRRRAG
jgi:hypothetical protein